MQEKIELTLAVCAYNCERYIKDTLNSIMAQTFQNFDLLLINDCSTDNTLKVIERFFEMNPRQHEIINFEQNQGIGYARHYAERYAKTKYLLFIDADDLPYPTLVEKLYNKIESDTDLMAVGCYLEYIDQHGKKIGGGQFLGEKTKEGFIEKSSKNKRIFIGISTIYNRELSLSVGGFTIDGFPDGKPRYRDYCEDLDLWTRMSDLYTKGKAIVVIPEILYQYRKMVGTTSQNTFAMSLKMKYVKFNLLRRRGGEKDLAFVDFYNSLSEKELKKLKHDSIVADALRQGAFLLKKGHVLKGSYYILKSIVMQPGYLWEKLKKNSGVLR
ncbi:MAG: glycosyltransferase family A protein [Salinivirgaceae bacterium]